MYSYSMNATLHCNLQCEVRVVWRPGEGYDVAAVPGCGVGGPRGSSNSQSVRACRALSVQVLALLGCVSQSPISLLVLRNAGLFRKIHSYDAPRTIQYLQYPTCHGVASAHSEKPFEVAVIRGAAPPAKAEPGQAATETGEAACPEHAGTSSTWNTSIHALTFDAHMAHMRCVVAGSSIELRGVRRRGV